MSSCRATNAKVRVLAGCAPCQPFSNYALRYQKDEKVEDDQRRSLLNHFGRLERELLCWAHDGGRGWIAVAMTPQGVCAATSPTTGVILHDW